MGRRKIDIEPITNERNRSVTFLKRKNGLFKKAYELGTLCTVDIAVIVFEERPGHPVKMHQYCSNNINHVMQRFIRFEGKRECRGPLDYNDKLGDDDDEDEIEDEAPPPPPVPVKRPSGKATTRTMSMSTDIKPNIRDMASSSASDPEPLTKRQRLATDFDPVAAFADMPASSSHRYQQGLMAAASSASNLGLAALFPPRSSHGIGLPGLTYPIQHSAFVGLPPATNHPSLYGLPPAHGHAPLGGHGQGHDYHGPPPDIRASAAASYAAALARGDVHTARVASAALYGMHDGGGHGHDGLAGSPPSTSMLPSSRYADTFEFEWPEHRVSASRSGQGQSLFDPVGRGSSSQQDRSSANRLDPRSADDLWLSFLGSGDNARDNNGGNNAGPSPAVRTVAENGESVESWLHSLDSGTGMAGMDGDGDLPRSNSDSAEHSLPSPVHSHGGDE